MGKITKGDRTRESNNEMSSILRRSSDCYQKYKGNSRSYWKTLWHHLQNQATDLVRKDTIHEHKKLPSLNTMHRTDDFKYLVKILQMTGLTGVSNDERKTKLNKVWKLVWNHYNLRSISQQADLQHYDTQWSHSKVCTHFFISL